MSALLNDWRRIEDAFWLLRAASWFSATAVLTAPARSALKSAPHPPAVLPHPAAVLLGEPHKARSTRGGSRRRQRKRSHGAVGRQRALWPPGEFAPACPQSRRPLWLDEKARPFRRRARQIFSSGQERSEVTSASSSRLGQPIAWAEGRLSATRSPRSPWRVHV